ncbi:MAG: tRNA (N6-threonylcarbamoyladenosine(37)-N6)-methyltransferase TrmO [Dehalococcoidia bacterium]|nr:tRNA (N6-threonylcarbamoyladenosine(37)-N6)-methyltransferase TrmO [Dehalococcoidia bacterium]
MRSEVKAAARQSWKKVIAEIVIEPRWAEALDNLDEFSHITILYWMHRSSGEPPVKIHPHGQKDLPIVGLFSTRSPNRPNPIGKTVVRLLERRGNVLKVQGLDAIDGTPVIDIKPYIPGNDSVQDESVDGATVPEWVRRIHEKHS